MSLSKLDSLKLTHYILAKCGPINHLKLQKLLYYVEAFHLAYFDSSLIDDHFEAWLHGPVSRKVWDYVKTISLLYDNVTLKDDSDKNIVIKEVSTTLTSEQLDLINDVLDEFNKLSSYQLETLTHSEDPWLNARIGYDVSDKCSNTISKELMLSYYKKLLYGSPANSQT